MIDRLHKWIDRASGYSCMVTIHSDLGHYCGYVGLPEGHPYWGKDYADLEHVPAHGGLTFAEEIDGDWWLGFDTAHGWEGPAEWNLAYMRDQCARLAWVLRFPDALDLARQERELLPPPAKNPSEP